MMRCVLFFWIFGTVVPTELWGQFTIVNPRSNTNQFEFTVVGPNDIDVVIQSTSTFTNWTTRMTISLTNNSFDFSTLKGSKQFYRLFPPYSYAVTNGAISITKYNGNRSTLIIPSTLDGLPVVNIGDDAFGWCNSLTDVVIPNSVTNIGNISFRWCVNLTNIALSTNIVSIGNGAFHYCRKLNSITIPSSVVELGGNIFQNCESLTNAIISDGVSRIGAAMFLWCLNLSHVEIPPSVTSISAAAFQGCSQLKDIHIPESVVSIDSQAFFRSGVTNVVIPNSVVWMGSSMFSSCTNLISFTIGNGVSNLEWSDIEFYQCNKLNIITIGSGVTNISSNPLNACQWPGQGCNNIRKVYYKGNAPVINPSLYVNCSQYMTNYYTAGTLGWSSFFGGRPTAPWVQ